MAGILDEHVARLADARVERLCHRRRCGIILLAHNDRCRARDRWQGRAKIIAAEHATGFRIGGNVVTEKHVDTALHDVFVLRPESVAEPARGLELDKSLHAFGFGLLSTLFPSLGCFGAIPRRGVDKAEGLSALWELGGEGKRNAAAH